MADLTLEEFAARMGVTAENLEKMEAGQEEIPARFEDDAFVVADRAIRVMGYP
jgi:hypothetical protein